MSSPSFSQEKWSSSLGFFFSAVGSAIGLANIVRFPYILGANGGASFLIVYLLCLFCIGFPLILSEIVLGRYTGSNPSAAFRLTGGRRWAPMGKAILFIAWIIGAFYSVIAGKILGYLVEALRGNLSFTSVHTAIKTYQKWETNTLWSSCFHSLFLLLCLTIIYRGVRKGIEWGNLVMMPLLFGLLIFLVFQAFSFSHAGEGLSFLFLPDWSQLSPSAILIALGQACFTLSLGQGTMITYGSYLSKTHNIPIASFFTALIDSTVSILIAIVVFTFIFSAKLEPDQGMGLLFHTLPYIFSQMEGGQMVSIIFFTLVLLATISSEISVLEPCINYLIHEKGFSRKHAIYLHGGSTLIVGLGFVYSKDLLHIMSEVVTSLLLPLSALCTILLVGWKWGAHESIRELQIGTESSFFQKKWFALYLYFFFKYIAPLSIILIFGYTIVSYLL